MFIPCAVRSSFTLFIDIFGCLPLLLVLSTCPYSATTGSLFPSILVTCPNHVSLLFLSLSTICDLLSQLLSGNLVSYPVSSGPSQYSSQPAHLRHQYPPFKWWCQWCILHIPPYFANIFKNSPYFCKIYKCTPIFVQLIFFGLIYVFCLPPILTMTCFTCTGRPCLFVADSYMISLFHVLAHFLDIVFSFIIKHGLQNAAI